MSKETDYFDTAREMGLPSAESIASWNRLIALMAEEHEEEIGPNPSRRYLDLSGCCEEMEIRP